MKREDFIDRLKNLGSHRLIPFLGSGFVLDLGYPSWKVFLLQSADFVEKHSKPIADLVRHRANKGDYFGAGDLLREPEIPAADLYSFFRSLFEKHPTPGRIHREQANCPFAGFITTNFDKSIEQSLTAVGKTPESIADSFRFSRFSSRLAVFSAYSPEEATRRKEISPQRAKNGLVLKLYGDITCPEELVLGMRQLELLMRNESFAFLYRTLLSTYTLLFIGYSGNDPAFQWHCQNLARVCGTPSYPSYFLHPANEQPPTCLKDANIIPIPLSSADNFRELSLIIEQLSTHFTKPDALCLGFTAEEVSDSKLENLAFLCVGLTEGAYASSYQCAINSMIAEASLRVADPEDSQKIVQYLARTYHLSIDDAYQLLQQSDRVQIRSLLSSRSRADQSLRSFISTISTGLSTRALALGIDYRTKAGDIIVQVILKAFSTYGSSLSLSLLDAEPPESTFIDKVVRTSVQEMKLPGVGTFDKEVLSACFADLFIHPTAEEIHALQILAQAALAHSLASTFSGGLKRVPDLIPEEAYLDANVSIPLVANDHPRSSYYHELIVTLMHAGCDVFILDDFLNEMEHHCRLAHEELQLAGIDRGNEAKEYAAFHGPLWINAFISAFASGSGDQEQFPSYLQRTFGSSNPKRSDFRRLLTKLAVAVVDTHNFNVAPSVPLAVHIASEKGKLSRYKAQVLADHEAQQILWLHGRQKANVWFITEDVALRRILRRLDHVDFSPLPPARGVMPAQGAFLLIDSLSHRPSLHGTFIQFLWNPLYVEMVDSMLAAVLRKMPHQLKKLRELGYSQVRQALIDQLQTQMVRSEKDDLQRRANEFKLGKPEIVESILRMLGEEL